MATTVADQMSEILAAAGVERVYGIVGDILGNFAVISTTCVST